MSVLLDKHIDALRQIDRGECAGLEPWQTFPLYDRCLIEPGRAVGARKMFVPTKTGKLVLAGHPFPRPNPDPDPEPGTK